MPDFHDRRTGKVISLGAVGRVKSPPSNASFQDALDLVNEGKDAGWSHLGGHDWIKSEEMGLEPGHYVCAKEAFGGGHCPAEVHEEGEVDLDGTYNRDSRYYPKGKPNYPGDI